MLICYVVMLICYVIMLICYVIVLICYFIVLMLLIDDDWISIKIVPIFIGFIFIVYGAFAHFLY